MLMCMFAYLMAFMSRLRFIAVVCAGRCFRGPQWSASVPTCR